MKRSVPTNEIKLRVTRQSLRQTWLTWGLLPLCVFLVLTIAVDAAQAAEFAESPRRTELDFQALFALAAMLFLVAFTVDGHWTNAQRLARRMIHLIEQDGRQVRPESLIERAPVVFKSVYASSKALTMVGLVVGAFAVLAAAAGLGINYSLLVLTLAAEYQLFVLSRHPYYMELMDAAAEGRLLAEAESDANGSARVRR